MRTTLHEMARLRRSEIGKGLEDRTEKPIIERIEIRDAGLLRRLRGIRKVGIIQQSIRDD